MHISATSLIHLFSFSLFTVLSMKISPQKPYSLLSPHGRRSKIAPATSQRFTPDGALQSNAFIF
jgi:hypothetical protein